MPSGVLSSLPEVLSCAPFVRWFSDILTLPAVSHDAIPANATAAIGNTYKNMYEKTTMNSGLSFVVLVNVVVAWLGVLFYRYVILREAGLLSPEEVRLLKKYPSVRTAQSYTPTDAYVRAPPPMRWTGWPDFFTSTDSSLSRDAQVYLLFQRACMLTTALCAIFGSCLLLPSYWFGGAVFKTEGDKAPRSLLSLLKSDRGVFERFTSHNLPEDSPLVLFQLPVILVTALCIVILYTVVKAAAGEQRSVAEWLQDGSSTPVATPTPSADVTSAPSTPRATGKASATPRFRSKGRSYWTLFARGLPQDVQNADEIVRLLEAIYPGQVLNVELVCKGRTSEARLLRELSSARNRLDYLYDTADDESFQDCPQTMFGRIFGFFTPTRTRAELIRGLEREISKLRSELESRKMEPVREFMGCAFISFRSAAAAGSALNDFPVRFESNSSAAASTVHGNYNNDLTIGRHDRVSSDWGFPRLRNLYKGTVNLLPHAIRERVVSSTIAPMHLQEEQLSHQQLLGTIREESDFITAEVATSRLRNMKAERAPKSGDIVWRNIGLSFFERTVREMIVQVIVFAILILFTSPVAMLTALKLVFAEIALLSDPSMIFGNAAHHDNSTLVPRGIPFNETTGLAFFNFSANDANAAQTISEDFLDILPDFLTSHTFLRSALLNYLPVLFLAIIFAAVPSLLRLTCALEGYPTHSAQEMSVFRKTSFYYVMNAVVLPSLALNTASEFLEMIYKQSGGGANVYNALPILQRLFSGDIAFFLCTYLVQLALSGSVFWLMRIPSSLSMMVRRRMALTPLEGAEAKCTDIFDYPRHYAYTVTVMSMCLLFGFMAPLIWWFALLYFVCKHLVDLYTIRYVHPRSHIDGRLPRLSAHFILTWTTVSQLSLAVIYYLQGWARAGVATAFLCILTLACCLSVNAHVGNRIMRFIAAIRDKAIEKMMSIGGHGYNWMPSPSLVTSSSTSSSTQSFPESSESDALLNKPQPPGNLSAVEFFENRLWCEEPEGSPSYRPNRIGEGVCWEQPGTDENGCLRNVPEQDTTGDPLTTDSCVSDHEDSDSDADIVVLERDVEDRSARRVLEYGTCGTQFSHKSEHSP